MNERRKTDANRDPITKEPGSHPVGTGVGAAAGGAAGAAVGGAAGAAAAGAAAGSAAGPIGTAVGLVAGAAIGAAAGHGAGEALNPTSEPGSGRFIDYAVVDRNNDKVGTVDAVWQDHSGPAYLAVRTGWLGMGKAHVVPAQAAEVDERNRRIRLPFTAEQVKAAPAFDATADLDNDSESRVTKYYATHGFRGYRYDQGASQQTSTAAQAASARSQRQTQDEARVQLKEEEVKVGKREVEYGGVRLRKVVRTEVINQPVELKREEIVIERVPATDATARTDANFQEKELYIPLRREEAVVSKEAHVREEVRLGKRKETERQEVRETVRKEDVEIDREGMAGSRQNAPGTRTSTAAGPYQAKERSRNS